MAEYDLLIKGGSVVFPDQGTRRADLAVRGERIAAVSETIAANRAERVIDASGKHVFPGAVDSHFHVGIYRPLKEDATTESTSAASGGVTTILTLFQAGEELPEQDRPV